MGAYNINYGAFPSFLFLFLDKTASIDYPSHKRIFADFEVGKLGGGRNRGVSARGGQHRKQVTNSYLLSRLLVAFSKCRSG